MKRHIVIVIFLITLLLGLSACGVILGLTACGGNYLQEDQIDSVFEQDYVLIQDIAKYLLSLEEPYVGIDLKRNEVKSEFGEPMKFQSSEIEELVGELKEKGYYHIQKKENVVVFDVWRRRFNVEFESGFVYSVDGSGDLSAIQFLISQRPLSEESWYYYEVDFNEWRVKRNKTGDGSVS